MKIPLIIWQTAQAWPPIVATALLVTAFQNCTNISFKSPSSSSSSIESSSQDVAPTHEAPNAKLFTDLTTVFPLGNFLFFLKSDGKYLQLDVPHLEFIQEGGAPKQSLLSAAWAMETHAPRDYAKIATSYVLGDHIFFLENFADGGRYYDYQISIARFVPPGLLEAAWQNENALLRPPSNARFTTSWQLGPFLFILSETKWYAYNTLGHRFTEFETVRPDMVGTNTLAGAWANENPAYKPADTRDIKASFEIDGILYVTDSKFLYAFHKGQGRFINPNDLSARIIDLFCESLDQDACKLK